MTDRMKWYESLDELESQVRSAASYVKPSRDLRPRVLEAARFERVERRARRHIGRAALLAAASTLLAVSGVEPLNETGSIGRLTLVASSSRPVWIQAAGKSDSAWALVEAYTELRRRQAEVLQF